MNVAIGSDHAGFALKEVVKKHLVARGYKVKDFGAHSEDRADYPDFAHPVAIAIEDGDSDLGIVICGSGNGVNMTVNKHQEIRGALCWTAELAALARQHNDANVLALPARFISQEVALACVDAFFDNTFEGGRHTDRVDKISC